MALVGFAISPTQRSLMINKRKVDEGGLCFSARCVTRSTLVCLLGRKKLCFPLRNGKCLFGEDNQEKHCLNSLQVVADPLCSPRSSVLFGVIVLCFQTEQGIQLLPGWGSGLCLPSLPWCFSFLILLVPAKECVKVSVVSAEKGSQALGVKN